MNNKSHTQGENIVKKAWIAKRISSENHTLEEVCQYIQDKYGFQEIDKNTKEYQEEYTEMRAGFLMMYSPELLGSYADKPELKSHNEEDIRKYMEEMNRRKNVAMKVSKEEFDIDFHKYKKVIGDTEWHIIIEKKFVHIGGGASGNGEAKVIKEFNKMFKDVYRYYGVTKEDIRNRTKRYDTLLRRLAT